MIILLSLLFTNSAIAAFNPEQWKYYKDVKVKAIGEELLSSKKYALIELDDATFNNSMEELTDLRLIDNQGREVPYYLQPIPYFHDISYTPSADVEYPARILNNSVVSGQYSTFILDLQKKSEEPHNLLNIYTKSTNFLRMVEIEGSDDKVTWHKLATGKHIFSFQEQSNTSIRYNESIFRYLRVKVWNKGEKPIEINSAQIQYRKVVPLQEQFLSRVKMTQSEDKDNKNSIIKLDLGSRNIPSHQVNFIIPDDNFRRQVNIEGSNDGKKWSHLGEDILYSINVDNYKFSKLNLKYELGHYRYLKLTIANKDNQPLNFTGVKVVSHARRLLFPYEKQKSYKLYYGNTKAQGVSFDLSDIKNYIKQENLPIFILGKEQANSKFNSKTQRPWSEENSWILVVVLVGVVGVLGIYIIKMMKNINKSS